MRKNKKQRDLQNSQMTELSEELLYGTNNPGLQQETKGLQNSEENEEPKNTE